MIRLGLRIGVLSGFRTTLPTLVTAFAAGLGTLLMLLLLSIAPAMHARADRVAWMDAPAAAATSAVPDDATFIATSPDYLGGESVTVVDLAGTGPGAPVPPGLTALPAVGDVALSPALAARMSSHPDSAGRYGTVVGVVGDAGLGGPDALVAVRGVDLHEAMLVGTPVQAFAAAGEVFQVQGMEGVLIVVAAVAMLVPVLLLVTIGAHLSARSRERRFSTLRLVGATRRQVTQFAAVEALVPGLLGVMLGCALFVALRPAAAHVSYDSGRWFVRDLMPSTPALVVVVVGVPFATMIATMLTIARAQRSTLNTTGRSRASHVSLWRMLPLVLVLPVAYLLVSGTIAAQVFGGGSNRSTAVAFALIVVAVLFAGPWLTQAAGTVMARSGRAGLLLAGRRLTDEPRGAFRAVSSVVLAVLITCLFIITTPAVAETLASTDGSGQRAGTARASIFYASPEQSETVRRLLSDMPGISAPALVYEGTLESSVGAVRAWIGDCDAIRQGARLTDLPCGKTPVLATAAAVDTLAAADANGGGTTLNSVWAAEVSSLMNPPVGVVNQITVPAGPVTPIPSLGGADMPDVIIDPHAVGEPLSTLRPTLLVMNYANDSALERARTVVLQQVPGAYISTRQTAYDGYSQDVRRLYRIITIATMLVFLVASFSLAVSALIGLVERQRPFALMRAGGAPLSVLRGVVLLESAVPLIVGAVVATALGALVGLWVAAAAGGAMSLPWVTLLLPVGAGLAVCLLMTAASVPFIGRITDGNAARFE